MVAGNLAELAKDVEWLEFGISGSLVLPQLHYQQAAKYERNLCTREFTLVILAPLVHMLRQ